MALTIKFWEWPLENPRKPQDGLRIFQNFHWYSWTFTPSLRSWLYRIINYIIRPCEIIIIIIINTIIIFTIVITCAHRRGPAPDPESALDPPLPHQHAAGYSIIIPEIVLLYPPAGLAGEAPHPGVSVSLALNQDAGQLREMTPVWRKEVTLKLSKRQWLHYQTTLSTWF